MAPLNSSRSSCILVACLSLLLFASIARAQSNAELKALNERVGELYRAGKYAEPRVGKEEKQQRPEVEHKLEERIELRLLRGLAARR